MAALLACSTAQAAAPRDAIRHLPELSHTSTVETIDTTVDGRVTEYRDIYRGDWQLGWHPPNVALGPTTSLGITTDYKLLLTDELNRAAGGGVNVRADYYDFALELSQDLAPASGGGKLHVGHWFTRRHTSTVNFNPEAEQLIEDTRRSTVSLQLAPGMQVSSAIAATSNYSGATGRLAGSERENAQLIFDYRPQSTAVAQQFRVATDKLRTRNYAQGGESHKSRSEFQGHRQLQLGNIGRFQIGYDYRETLLRESFQLEPTSQLEQTTYAGLEGQVAGLPLNYDFRLTDVTVEPGPRTYTQLANFSFSPTLAGEQRAQVSAQLRTLAEESPTNRRSSSYRRLAWSYAPNPRLQSNVEYYSTSNINESLMSLNSEVETVTGSLSYEVPGDSGQFNLRAEQQSEQSDTGSALRSMVELRHNIRLSPRDNLNFVYAQSQTDSGLFNPAVTDITTAGVQYQVQPSTDLSVNAFWNQVLTHNGQADQTNSQQLNVTLNWKPSPQWAYIFRVQSTDESFDSYQQPVHRYSTRDQVQAVVTFSF